MPDIAVGHVSSPTRESELGAKGAGEAGTAAAAAAGDECGERRAGAARRGGSRSFRSHRNGSCRRWDGPNPDASGGGPRRRSAASCRSPRCRRRRRSRHCPRCRRRLPTAPMISPSASRISTPLGTGTTRPPLAGREGAHEGRRCGGTGRPARRAEAHAERAPGLAEGDVEPEDAGTVLALERHQVAALHRALRHSAGRTLLAPLAQGGGDDGVGEVESQAGHAGSPLRAQACARRHKALRDRPTMGNEPVKERAKSGAGVTLPEMEQWLTQRVSLRPPGEGQSYDDR